MRDHESGLVGYPVPVADIEAQKRFEIKHTELGVERFHKSIASATISDTPLGRKVAKDVLAPMAKEIKRVQKRAAKELRTVGGRDPWGGWRPLLMTLKADKLAVITLRTIMSNVHPGDMHSAPSVAVVSRLIGQNCRYELEFEMWRQAEAEAAKLDPKHTDMFKLMMEYNPNPNAAVVRRWRSRMQKRVVRIHQEPWTLEQRVGMGSCLVDVLVRKGGGWFEITRFTMRRKTMQVIHFSTPAIKALGKTVNDLEVSKPYLLPMTCPPKPWVIE